MALPLSLDVTPESIVTSLGAAQALFFGVYILAARRHNSANVFLAGFMFAFATVWIGEFFLSIGADPAFRYFIAPIDALLAPLMYLYVTGLIEPRPGTTGNRRLLHLSVAGLVLALLIPWTLLPTDLQTAPIVIDLGGGFGAGHPWVAGEPRQLLPLQTAPTGLLVSVLCLLVFVLLYQIQVTAYVAALVIVHRRFRRRCRQDSAEVDPMRLHWMGFVCIWSVVIWTTVVPFNLLGISASIGPAGNLLQEIAQLVIVYALGFAGVRQPMIYAPVPKRVSASCDDHTRAADACAETGTARQDARPKYARSGLSRAALGRIAEKLNRAMVEQELYLESSLTLPRLADRTGVPTNHISQVLNEHFGRNFFEFVNGFRIEAAKGHLLSSNKTVLDVALAAGFNSKSTFNAAFKKIVGQTPSQFRTTQALRQIERTAPGGRTYRFGRRRRSPCPHLRDLKRRPAPVEPTPVPAPHNGGVEATMLAALSKLLLSRSGRIAVICVLLLALVALANPSWGDDAAAPQDEESSAETETWKFTLGAGVGIGPAYEGSEELEVSPVPLVTISWRDIVTLGPDRLAVHASGVGPVSASLSVGYNGGRDEDDSDDLEGLGDIGPAAQIGLDVAMELAEFGPFRAAAEAAVRQDIGGADGLTVAAGPSLSYQATPTLGFEVAASATWADSRHMEDYFGISASQARASGRPEFDPDSGIKRVDLSLGANWQAFENWTVMGKVGVGRLISDAADSPITESKLQTSTFLGVGYSF